MSEDAWSTEEEWQGHPAVTPEGAQGISAWALDHIDTLVREAVDMSRRIDFMVADLKDLADQIKAQTLSN